MFLSHTLRGRENGQLRHLHYFVNRKSFLKFLIISTVLTSMVGTLCSHVRGGFTYCLQVSGAWTFWCAIWGILFANMNSFILPLIVAEFLTFFSKSDIRKGPMAELVSAKKNIINSINRQQLFLETFTRDRPIFGTRRWSRVHGGCVGRIRLAVGWAALISPQLTAGPYNIH